MKCTSVRAREAGRGGGPLGRRAARGVAQGRRTTWGVRGGVPLSPDGETGAARGVCHTVVRVRGRFMRRCVRVRAGLVCAAVWFRFPLLSSVGLFLSDIVFGLL